MFLRCTNREKDGKDHRYWSVVENRRVSGGRVVQRHVLYLGEINDSRRESWRKTIEVFEDGYSSAKTVALFPEDRSVEIDDEQVVQIRLKDVELRHPRQWGACWLYKQLGLDEFWAKRLPPSRRGTRWDMIVKALCCYRLIDPGSEWRLHRHWYETSAMADFLGAGFELVEIHKLYGCLDRLIAQKRALFDHLTQRWKDMFELVKILKRGQAAFLSFPLPASPVLISCLSKPYLHTRPYGRQLQEKVALYEFITKISFPYGPSGFWKSSLSPFLILF